MADHELTTLVRHLHKLVASQASREFSDRQLLDQFVSSRDDAAFAALLKRHGPLVFAVCRRVHERKVKAVVQRNPTPDLAWSEVQAILDAEIQCLSQKYRAVFVLCCLCPVLDLASGRQRRTTQGVGRRRRQGTPE
jgi:hypothetical protein